MQTGLHFADAHHQGSFQAFAHCLKTVASSNAQPGYLLFTPLGKVSICEHL